MTSWNVMKIQVIVYFDPENLKVQTNQRVFCKDMLLFTQWDMSRPWKVFSLQHDS